MKIRCYHLPGIDDQVKTTPLPHGGRLQIDLPCMDPTQLRTAITCARQAARLQLCRRSVEDLLALVDRVVHSWLCPDYHLRRCAEEALPLVTGFSAEMVRHGLPLLVESVRASTIRSLLDTELGNHRVLDGMWKGRHAVGPSLITHVLSGNIPGLAAVPMLLSLLLKSAVLVKSAAGDPIFPALLAASIAEADPDVAQRVLVTYWRGGNEELEEAAFSAADLVVASGSNAAVASLASRVRGRFIGHGHKISFAAIGKERLTDGDAAKRLARALAYDVSLWDQQGCLSPQLCYVEKGGAVTPFDFAGHLADALTAYATALPPRRLSLDERAHVLRFRQEAEWGDSLRSEGSLLASSGSTDWSISVETNADFVPTCLNRCLRLKLVSDLTELPTTLAVHRRYLEGAGIAVGAARLVPFSAMLARSGVHRICPIGAMQRPPLSWQQGGRPRIADWVEWTAVENSETVEA